MAFPTLTETFNELYATTWQLMGKKVIDQVFKKMPLFYWFDRKQRTTSEGGAGRWIGRQVRLRKNTAAKSFGRGETFDEVDLNTVTVARYEWKNVGIPLTRYWEDERVNRGKAQMINLVRENTENTVESLRETIQNQLWAATPGSKDLYSVPYFVATAPTTGTVAGINRANESAWRNQTKDSDADGSAYNYLLKQIQQMVDVTVGTWGTVDYICCGTDAFSIYCDLVREQKMITDKRMGDAEFANVSWRGIPLVFDTYAPTDEMYFFDSRTWEFVTDPGAYFTWTSWKEIPDGLDKMAQLIVRGQVINTKPEANGVIFDIAA